MKFKLKDFAPSVFFLPVFFLMILVFFQCVTKKEEMIPSNQTASEKFQGLKEISSVEDPDPVIEDPDYGELFHADEYLVVLKEFLTVDGKEELTPSAKRILQTIEEQVMQADPEIKALMQHVDMDLLQGMLDPDKALDPQLELFLEELLAMEELEFPLPNIPGIPEAQKSAGLESDKDRKSGPKAPKGGEQWRTLDEHDDCVAEVYDEYEPGFRVCGLEWEQNITEIEGNFVRRMGEAEERRLQRNELIEQLYSQRFVLMDQIMAQVVETVKKLRHMEKFEAVKTQLGGLGLVYAYYIRNHLSTLYTGGLALNEWYYQKEVNVITDVRDRRLEAAEVHNQECFARVEEMIEEEIENRCL